MLVNKIECFYEVDAGEGFAFDEEGNKCPAYVKYGFELGCYKEVTEEQVMEFTEKMREDVANMLKAFPGHLTSITKEEYVEKVGESEED